MFVVQAFALTALFMGASVGVHLQEAGEVPFEEAVKLTQSLARTLEGGGVRRVIVDDPVWSTCPSDLECADQVRARTEADDVVLLRIFGGVNKLRLVVLRFRSAAREPTRIELDLPRASETWPASLIQTARRLYPEEHASTASTSQGALLQSSAPPAAPVFRPLPLALFVGGALSAAIGIGFGISSKNARSESERTTISDQQFETLADRTQAHAIVADVLYAVAAACALAGIALLVWSD